MKPEDFDRIAVVNERGFFRIKREAHGYEEQGRAYYIPNARAMAPDEALYVAGQLERAAADVESGASFAPENLREVGVYVAPDRQIWLWARIGPSRRFIPPRDFVVDPGLTPTQARALAGKIKAAVEGR